ncbi:hypothetical protein ACFL5K_05510 [Gemmatimonadota bacterium]
MIINFKEKPLAGLFTVGLALWLGLCIGCSDNDNPIAPDLSGVLPVESSSQLAGRWESLSVYANGLSVTRYLIPAFSPAVYNARLSSYSNDLIISVTGEYTGLFSTIASGVAVDTSTTLTAQGDLSISGSFGLADQGLLTVTLSRDNPSDNGMFQSFDGTASLAGDTLILNFTLAVPPEKQTGFLPDTTSFIARLIRAD